MSLTLSVSGAYPVGPPNGSEALQPIPMALLDRITSEKADVTISVVGGERSWTRLLRVVAQHDGRTLRAVDDPSQATWVLVVRSPSTPHPRADQVHTLREGGPPKHRAFAGGLDFEAFKRTAQEPL